MLKLNIFNLFKMNDSGLSLENDNLQQQQQKITNNLINTEKNCYIINNNNCKNNNFIDSTTNDVNFTKMENILKDEFAAPDNCYNIPKNESNNLTNTIGNAFCGESNNDVTTFTTNNCQRYPSTALGYYSNCLPQQQQQLQSQQQQQYTKNLNYDYSLQQFNIKDETKSTVSTNNWNKTDQNNIENILKTQNTQNDFQKYQLIDQTHQFSSSKVYLIINNNINN